MPMDRGVWWFFHLCLIHLFAISNVVIKTTKGTYGY